MEFTFTLRYHVAAQDRNLDQLAERLAASDCADALVGVARNGYLTLNFLRQADSAEAAMAEAIADVEWLMPGAELIDIRSDFMPS
jgi:hypothetical protein